MSTGGGPVFTDRTVHTLGVATFGAWRIKRYALAVSPDGPRPAVIDAADTATAATRATRRRAAGDIDPDDVGSLTLDGHLVRIGFTIIHEARPACFLQINRWHGVDLVQHYLTAPLHHPGRWTLVGGGAIGCVWELPIIAHERDSWVRHVLAPANGPQPEAYLDDVFPSGRTDPEPARSADSDRGN